MPPKEKASPGHRDVDGFQVAYDETRHYHLTSKAGKESIRAHGFNLSRKVGNSAEAFGLNEDAVKRSANFHYVASTVPQTGSSKVTAADRVTAKRLPQVVTDAHRFPDPKVVRVMADPSEISPDQDFFVPDGYDSMAYIMGDQPKEAVLRAHGSAPYDRAVDVFRRRAESHLHRPVSAAEAKEKLMECQSDSEDDEADLT